MFTVDVHCDSIGHPRHSLTTVIVASVGHVSELVAAAIIACDDNSGIVDIALGTVVVHVLCFADACFHVCISDRSLDHIKGRYLMVVDFDVFLAGSEKNDIQTEEQIYIIFHGRSEADVKRYRRNDAEERVLHGTGTGALLTVLEVDEVRVVAIIEIVDAEDPLMGGATVFL